LTYETKLVPKEEDVYLTPTTFTTMRDGIANKTEVKDGFKNSFIVSLKLSSPRQEAKTRKVSIKVFRNLRLHITGTHSLDMVQHVVDVIKGWLSEIICIAIKEDIAARQVDVVLYKYQLPGEVNLNNVRDVLKDKGILSIYDPNNYAGVRAKFLIDDKKYASVMIFRKGKIIIIIPRQSNFDKTLQNIMDRIESTIITEWDLISVKQSILKRKRVS
jgi:TATA-box binding protein (TBP) (component of TFIID and TFIIIB)